MREFQPQYLPTWLIRQVAARRDDDGVWTWARAWLEKAMRVKPARSSKVTTIMEDTVHQLAVAAHGLYQAKTNQQRFVNQAVSVMQDGIQRSYLAGARTHERSYALSADSRARLQQRARQQTQWLARLAQTVSALALKASAVQWLNTNPAMRQRMALYAGSLHGAYQLGELDGWKSAHNDQPRIVWHADPDPAAEVCPYCAARDGQEFTEASLPGFPGDGAFGSSMCVAPPNCRCFLTFEPSGVMITPEKPITVQPVPVPSV